jgi:hypothetical protein
MPCRDKAARISSFAFGNSHTLEQYGFEVVKTMNLELLGS